VDMDRDHQRADVINDQVAEEADQIVLCIRV
jgi:hypothetical protein